MMMLNNANNISAWMVMNQFGEVKAGPGSARDNIIPSNITKISKGFNCKLSISFEIS